MNAEPPTIDQAQLTGIICERPQNFAWFLGAGASRSAGLPTATDIIRDLKRRYYCQQENEDIPAGRAPRSRAIPHSILHGLERLSGGMGSRRILNLL
jgi:hypothetical protein